MHHAATAAEPDVRQQWPKLGKLLNVHFRNETCIFAAKNALVGKGNTSEVADYRVAEVRLARDDGALPPRAEDDGGIVVRREDGGVVRGG